MLALLRRSSLAFVLACLAWTGSVQAAGIIRITEVMSSSGTGGTPDWFEITNYGTAAVDLSNWRMDDDTFNFAVAGLLTPYTTGTEAAWTSIAPGSSVVFIESSTPATAVPNFRTFWGGLPGVQIGTFSGSGLSLSSGGDGVAVFNSAGTEVHRVNFGAATGGSSFYWNYDADGALATSGLGSISTAGFDNAFTTTGAVANTGSPGLSVTAAPVVNLYWTASGTSLGGNGSWDVVSNRWSSTASPVNGGPWADERTAVFSGTGGTVTVNAAVAPVGLDFQTSGYVLASGSGSIATATANVLTGGTATIAARLTGPTGLGVSGTGTLILSGTANDYAGLTSVAAGTLKAGASEVIPNGSRLAVSRFMTADLSGYRETVNGIAGLGTIITGSSLTVSITGSNDIVFDGFLRGSGDFIVDSPGTGAQRLDTSTTTLGDGAVKDYAGRTIVQRGTLAVHFSGIPDKTTAVDVEPAGTLRLSSNGRTYTFGLNSGAATQVNLNGGTLTQGQGDDVELTNAFAVSGTTGRIFVANETTPDPLVPTTEEIRLSGVLSGSAGTLLALVASNTTPGADKGRVEFVQAAGNTFAGTIKPQVNMTARVEGDYGQMSVALEGGEVDGYGVVDAISGVGIVAPRGSSASGILTASSVAPQAGMNFEFDFTTADSDPVWFSPSLSENDVLRLTGATPIASSLTSANTVRMFFGTASLEPTTTFRGGFFTTADSTALITNATLEAYVLGDGFGTDIVHADLGYYSLATYATATGQTLTPSLSMVAAGALFDGATTTNGFVTRVAFNEPVTPPDTGPIVIDVPSGSQTQAEAGRPTLSGDRTVTKTGVGTVVFDTANTHTAQTTVQQGSLKVANANALAASPTVVAAGAALQIDPGVTMKAPSVTVQYTGTLSAPAIAVNAATGVANLTIDGGSVAGSPAVTVGAGGTMSLADDIRQTVSLTSLAVDEAAGGRIDIGVGRINVAAGGITAADLRADLLAARNGGAWNGASGIGSSEANNAIRRAVGYRVTGSGATIAWAAFGDMNLDGFVNSSDLNLLLAGGKYGTAATDGVWAQGDFNYDGRVNTQDLNLLLAAGLYGQPTYLPSTTRPLGGLGFMDGGDGESATLGGITAVPEPSSLMLSSIAILSMAGFAVQSMLKRRRRASV